YVIHVSPDDASSSIGAVDVEITNDDNDAASVIVTPTTGLVTTESGGQATFTVVLGAQPTGGVTIGLTSSNVQEGTGDQAMLAFTPDNWNAPPIVTSRGLDD